MSDKRSDQQAEIRVSVHEGIASVLMNAPPVNALSAALRVALQNAFTELAARDDVDGIVVGSAIKIFCGGADIKEFGRPPTAPTLPELLELIENLSKPVVAAIDGAALGGGCELALACHGRVGSSRAFMGLPEVKLGIIPGAGGTQRLPRIISPLQAFQIMVSGEPISAASALEAGLIDVIAEDPIVSARTVARTYAQLRDWPTACKAKPLRNWNAQEFDEVLDKALTEHNGHLNVPALARAVRAALELPFEEGMALERREFNALLASEQAAALRHVFFAERSAARIPDLSPDDVPADIKNVAVVGAGTMGVGIAMTFANAGIPVTLIDANKEALGSGIAKIETSYRSSSERGKISSDEMRAKIALINGSIDLEQVATADLVVEAVFEDMQIKRALFEKLGRIAKPDAVLATNTSYLDVNEIALSSGRAERVLGLHFFSPANVMRLLEVVVGKQTNPAVLATGVAIGRRLGKLPVVSKDCFGFIGNRMLQKRSRAAEHLLLSGSTTSRIDKLLTDFGFRMGHFAMSDLAGIDIGWRMRKAFGGFAPVADRLAELGRFGQKSGRGFYLYPANTRVGVADIELDKIVDEEARTHGVVRQDLDDQSILERLLYPLVNEGSRILEEGIAYRASDIDLIWINGYGWPKWTGGPMYWADRQGLPKIVEALSGQAAATGDSQLIPSDLLRRLAENGAGFADFARA
jgi:3-hydroxyacyl-CoA dehydrogenase